MMRKGEIHPHSLVTSLHTEDYSADDASEDNGGGCVDEAHIDTGKWCMLQQVWQLRWQLCTDGSSTGVFGPTDVALTAIRSLSRLVDLHKSLDPRGIPYYPIPIAKRLLCGGLILVALPSTQSMSTRVLRTLYLLLVRLCSATILAWLKVLPTSYLR